MPLAIAQTLERREGFDDAAALVRGGDVERLVVSGNGAAYYVGMALWLASLQSEGSLPSVCVVPSGLVAGGRFPWRPRDLFVAVSSSGEFRDLVEATGDLAGRYLAITASPQSTVGRSAAVQAVFTVLAQRAVTHTQVVCGAVATVLSVWAEVSGDVALSRQLAGLPEAADAAVTAALAWQPNLATLVPERPRWAVACGSGPAWAAALEAALLLKEVADIPAEGVETREAATSCMYALGPGDLVLTLPTGEKDPLLGEAEEICRATGAVVARAPEPVQPLDDRLASVTCLPAATIAAVDLARRASLDVDRPDWVGAYYGTARRSQSR
ncbi:MAG: hypothetical protein ACYCR4_08935 [Acidimicrobiales bacterium]